jgi:hypothetical protein
VEKERERETTSRARARAEREIDVIFEFFQSRLSLALSREMMMPKFPSAQKERRRRRKKRTALAFTNHPNFCSSPSSAGGTWYPNSASNASSSRAISKGVFVVPIDDALLFVGPFPP